MDWLWAYVVWGLKQITPQGVLVGLIAGSVLTWIARGEWARAMTEEEEHPMDEDPTRPLGCLMWREGKCDGYNCCINAKCKHAREYQYQPWEYEPWMFNGTIVPKIRRQDDDKS